MKKLNSLLSFLEEERPLKVSPKRENKVKYSSNRKKGKNLWHFL